MYSWTAVRTLIVGRKSLVMTFEGLSEMFQGDFADTYAKTISPLLIGIGGRAWADREQVPTSAKVDFFSLVQQT